MDGPDDVAPVPPIPSTPLPPPPTSSTAEVPPGRRTLWPWIVGGGLVLVAVISLIAVRATGGDGDSGMPDEVAGEPQLSTEETRAVAEMLDSISVGGIEIDMAFYGEGENPTFMLASYSNIPPGVPPEGLLRGAGGGIIGAGGTADVEDIQTRARGAITYSCIPFSGKLFPTDSASADGLACVWAEGEDIWLLMDLTTTAIDSAVDHADSIHLSLAS